MVFGKLFGKVVDLEQPDGEHCLPEEGDVIPAAMHKTRIREAGFEPVTPLGAVGAETASCPAGGGQIDGGRTAKPGCGQYGNAAGLPMTCKKFC